MTERRSDLRVLEQHPIELEGFTLTAHGVIPVGRPSIEKFQTALKFAYEMEVASPYWPGDLLAYAESRDDWKGKLDQITDVTGMARQTAINKAYIAKAVDIDTRKLAPTPTHAAKVAALTKPEQKRFLTRATDEGWTSGELEKHVRASKRLAVIAGQAKLIGKYRVIYADPPWKYGNKQPSGSSAQGHYPGMTIEQLCDLPVEAHATEDAVLFMWVTSPFLLMNPGPREVIEAWGFEYKTSIVWDKVRHNFGHYVGVHHELLLICTRGSCLPDEPTPMPDSVQVIRNEGEHSEKPEEFRQLIDRLYTQGKRVELFARKKVKGWAFFGNDARLWAGESVGS